VFEKVNKCDVQPCRVGNSRTCPDMSTSAGLERGSEGGIQASWAKKRRKIETFEYVFPNPN